jgi:hypothetical protein
MKYRVIFGFSAPVVCKEVTVVTSEIIQRWKTGERTFALSTEEKVSLMRMIDEYDFVRTVLKYKSAAMSEDLVRELTRQNDTNMEMIMGKLSGLS